MRKVAIIGLGHVGATVAYTIFTHGYADTLVLLDKNQAKVEAEYNDLRDTLARNNYYVNVVRQDWKELKDTDVIITAFGDIAATVKTGDRFGEFDINAKNTQEVGQQIKASGFNGVIINISNPCDAISTLLQESTGLSKNQVFGTGTFLDTARMQRIVGEKLNEDPRSVEGFVLGEHGASQFTAWSTVRVNGKSANELFSKSEEETLGAQPNKNSMRVAAGKGYTSYAIATCGVRLMQAVFANARLFAPTSVFLDEVGTYIGYPAIIGKDGIEEVPALELTEAEEQKLQDSASIIKKHIAQLK
ncbi:L-lactate dehydrogenase [Lactobacillus sp. PV034]|uniref:L-lactate dehydrogenase n=1 Tax=Lactobacillus sp. PV034 TaxID=2594495 RepID=UPI00223FB883|nr:L-lactate dehydrogenase [Lactobacillus sp. PV034]QNQ80905.1 L-lactate dehydrogenase [Lactobacillus sp. PV034]